MKTIVSKTGIEVLYPCTVHLLKNGEILECEYKSDHTGRDLLDYVCQYQHINEKEFWGLKYVDTFEQRHWLELDKLIRSQVKNVCPIHFHFRVKVYPPEPYKLNDKESMHQIFLQLRYDLMNGRLCSGPNDSALLLSLILQYTYGTFDPEIHCGNYIEDQIVFDQSYKIESKAIEIHAKNLNGLTRAQTEDLFLRMASQLKAYGIDPYLVESHNQSNLNLWVNHNGMVTYVDSRKKHHLKWMDINKVEQDETTLIVKMTNDETVEFICLTKAECNYIYRSVVDHLIYFTNTDKKSTVSLVGSELVDLFEEKSADVKITECVNKINKISEEDEAVSENLDYMTESQILKTTVGKHIVNQAQNYALYILFLLVIIGIVTNWNILLENNYFGLQILNRIVKFLIKHMVSIKK